MKMNLECVNKAFVMGAPVHLWGLFCMVLRPLASKETRDGSECSAPARFGPFSSEDYHAVTNRADWRGNSL